jgi:hypothetical protein
MHHAGIKKHKHVDNEKNEKAPDDEIDEGEEVDNE